MSPHTLLVYIFLLASYKVSCFELNNWSFFNGTTFYKVAPTEHDFTIAEYRADDNYPGQLRMNLSIQDDETTFRSCAFTLDEAGDAEKAEIVSLKRLKLLNSSKVVFSWHENPDDLLYVVGVDLEQCEPVNILNHPLKQYKPIIMPWFYGGFDLIVNSTTLYAGISEGQCAVSFNSDFEEIGQVQKFYDGGIHVSLDWNSIYVEPLHNGYFLIRGRGPYSDYHVYIIPTLGVIPPDVMVIPDEYGQIKVVSSQSAVCWIVNPKNDTSAGCATLNAKGYSTFWRSVNFDFPVTPIAVRSLSNGKILLIASKTHCTDDCWDMIGRVVSRNGELVTPILHFTCTGYRKNLTIFDVKEDGDELVIPYACVNEQNFVHSDVRFDRDNFRPPTPT